MIARNPAIRKTLSDLCAARETVIASYTQGRQIIGNADRALREIGIRGLPYDASPRDSVEGATLGIDRELWRRAFDLTGYAQLLDATNW